MVEDGEHLIDPESERERAVDYIIRNLDRATRSQIDAELSEDGYQPAIIEAAWDHLERHPRQAKTWVQVEHSALAQGEPRRVARSAATRSKWAIGALVFTAGVLLLQAFEDVRGIGLINDIERRSSADAAAFIDAYQAVSRAIGLGYLAAGITFLAWLSRSVDNVPLLGGGEPLSTPRWSIAWWFLPIANLWMPYRVVKDLDRRMLPTGGTSHGALIAWWWTLFVAAGVAEALLTYIEPPINDLASLFALGAALDAALILAAVLAVLVVWRIQTNASARQSPVQGGSLT